MPTWVFAIVIFLIGLGLAFYVDRLKARPGSNPRERREKCERSRWLTYWFTGRLPDKKECEEDEEGGRKGG